MRILIENDDGTVAELTEEVKVAYDAAYEALTAGSYGAGLDTEELKHLQRLGQAIGADTKDIDDDLNREANYSALKLKQQLRTEAQAREAAYADAQLKQPGPVEPGVARTLKEMLEEY